MKIHFFPISYSYGFKSGELYVEVIGRRIPELSENIELDSNKIKIRYFSFKPYILVQLDNKKTKEEYASQIVDHINSLGINVNNQSVKIIGTEFVKKRLYNKEYELLKLYFNIPKAIPKAKDELVRLSYVTSCFEYDILFTRRFIVDKKIFPFMPCYAEGSLNKDYFFANKIGLDDKDVFYEPNILAIDIESYSKNKYIIDYEKNPILMISLYGEKIKKVITWATKKAKGVENYNTEKEMLEAFWKNVIDEDIDIISGYYSDNFDLPYIFARCKKFNIEIPYTIRSDNRGKTFDEIVHLDLYKYIRRIMRTSLKTYSYSLDDVSEEILGDKKHTIDLSKLHEVWDKKKDDIEEYYKYNLKDSELVYKILHKLWNNIEELCKITSLDPYSLSRSGFSVLVENFIIKQSVDEKILMPPKPNKDQINNRLKRVLKGAFVYEPKPGMYANLVVFDFKSLYPTLICSHNLGKGALLQGSDVKGDVYQVPGQSHAFAKKPIDFLPSILQELIDKRDEVKEKLKQKKDDVFLNSKSTALKVLANSFYGYLGFYGARWYCFKCAEATTGFARHFIKDVINKAEKAGFNVVYSDTDSIFVMLGDKKLEDINDFVNDINKKLPHPMKLDFEELYKRGIFVYSREKKSGAKKKYAMVTNEGKFKIMGFETVRRDWSIIAKNLQKKVLEILLKEDDVKKAANYVRDVVDDLVKHKIEPENLVIVTQLKKPIDEYASISPHVAIAKRMKKKGITVGPGSMIEYVVTKGKGPIRDKARMAEEIDKKEYDEEYYVEHQIIPAVASIFDAVNHDIKEDLLKKARKQKTLDGWA